MLPLEKKLVCLKLYLFFLSIYFYPVFSVYHQPHFVHVDKENFERVKKLFTF